MEVHLTLVGVRNAYGSIEEKDEYHRRGSLR